MSHLARAVPSDAELKRRTTASTRTSLQQDGDNRRLSVISTAISEAVDGAIDDEKRTSAEVRSHQRFVLTDSVAARYLEEDQHVTVLDYRRQLEGYEVYIVEQWACSRTDPTFLITTYTGDPSHKVTAAVLSVPTDEDSWSRRLKLYFKALQKYHARRRETPLGTLMITNLSGFPSSLTVIPVPEGDTRKHREDFFVNENLKRMNCSGRVGLTLTKPSSATQSKFYQLYRTSEKNPLYASVIELVKLCQVALVLFGKLLPEYADGLLCDMTEKALNDWWLELGTEFYNIEPHDGILGPTTVSALLGMLMGARNRLNAYGAPVGKDVFDVENMKRGIAYFQKYYRLQKTRRLDRQTLERLRRATNKAANSEGWTVPRAVKSTVAELSGRGGEMVSDMLGGRDKAGIAEVETTDIDRFIQLVGGERAKWLWYAKPRKNASENMFSRLPGEDGKALQKHEHDRTVARKKDEANEDSSVQRKDAVFAEPKSPKEEKLNPDSDIELDPRRAVLIKRATGRMNDARSGFGRLKDAVRGHQHKHSRHENGSPYSARPEGEAEFKRQGGGPTSAPNIPRQNEDSFYKQKDEASSSMGLSSTTSKRLEVTPKITRILAETPLDSQTALLDEKDPKAEGDEQPELGAVQQSGTDEGSCPPTADVSTAGSIAGSSYRGFDLEDLLAKGEAKNQDFGQLLKRTRSLERYDYQFTEKRNDSWWPRHLSFSLAEDSILEWEDLVAGDKQVSITDPKKELMKELALAEEAKLVRERMAVAGNIIGKWVEKGINNVQDLEGQIDRDQQELDDIYYPRLEEYRSLREETQEILCEERAELQESIKEVEVLGAKLEYEINALRSKADDVEDCVAEFERQVVAVEARVKDFEDEGKGEEGWIPWVMRVVQGKVKPPDTE